jgi:hypothetical protein
VIVLIAGCLEFTAWKARHLACCREAPGRGLMLPAGAGTAWRHGVHLGLHCGPCCANLMAILLVSGLMDLRMMAVVAAAITVEHLAPAGSVLREPLEASSSGQGCFWSREQPGSDDASRLEAQVTDRPRAWGPSGVYEQGQNPHAAATSQRNRARKPSQVLGRTRS